MQSVSSYSITVRVRSWTYARHKGFSTSLRHHPFVFALPSFPPSIHLSLKYCWVLVCICLRLMFLILMFLMLMLFASTTGMLNLLESFLSANPISTATLSTCCTTKLRIHRRRNFLNFRFLFLFAYIYIIVPMCCIFFTFYIICE